MPRPNSAVTIGSPIARNEPKLTSSTTAAARTPIPVREPGACDLRLLDRLAAELDLQPLRCVRLAAVETTFLDRARRQHVRLLVEEDDGERGLAVARDLAAPGRGVRAQDPGDVRELRHAASSMGSTRCRTSGASTPAGAWKTIWSAITRLRGEALLQQVGRTLGAGVAEREVVRVVGAHGAPAAEDADEDDDPEHDHEPAPIRAETCEPKQRSAG